MQTLGNLSLFLLLAAVAFWLWHSHGIREHALLLARRHCEKLDLELLDGNVAFRRLAIVRDGSGHRRLARLYDFEFTVTGEQRLNGRMTLFGRQLGAIELDAHPLPQQPEPVASEPLIDDPKVIRLDDWRREHRRSGEG